MAGGGGTSDRMAKDKKMYKSIIFINFITHTRSEKLNLKKLSSVWDFDILFEHSLYKFWSAGEKALQGQKVLAILHRGTKRFIL